MSSTYVSDSHLYRGYVMVERPTGYYAVSRSNANVSTKFGSLREHLDIGTRIKRFREKVDELEGVA